MLSIQISAEAANVVLGGPYGSEGRLREDTLEAVQAGRRVAVTTSPGDTHLAWRFEATLDQAEDLDDWLERGAEALKPSDETTAGILFRAEADVAAAIAQARLQK